MPKLEEFKTAINLTEYAAFCGYELDRKESSRNSVIMRHPSGDKIIVSAEQTATGFISRSGTSAITARSSIFFPTASAQAA